MKRFVTVIFAALLGVLTTGCIETQMLVTVDNDGSGTVEERVVMNKMMVGMMKGMAQSMGGEEGEKKENGAMFTREDVEDQAAKMGEGVKLQSFEEIDDASGTGYVAVFSFEDINSLRVKQDPGESMPTMSGEEDESAGAMEDPDEFIYFAFEPGTPATLVITPPKDDEPAEEEMEQEMEMEQDSEGEDQQMQMGGLEQMAQFMRGMRISLAVQVDGKIVETNAQYVDGSKVTIMDIEFDKLIDNPEKLKELEAAEGKGPAAVQELLKDVPGMKIDIANNIRIVFN